MCEEPFLTLSGGSAIWVRGSGNAESEVGPASIILLLQSVSENTAVCAYLCTTLLARAQRQQCSVEHVLPIFGGLVAFLVWLFTPAPTRLELRYRYNFHIFRI